jgi:short-subunit dehydrogenase
VNLELTGKTALVTGGSLGIGRAIAFGLAAEGARVAICARDKSRLEQTAQEVKAKTNAEALIVPGDLSQARRGQSGRRDGQGAVWTDRHPDQQRRRYPRRRLPQDSRRAVGR